MRGEDMILDAFNNEMSRRRVRLHGAVLFKGGKVIEEIYRPPYSRSEKTRMYSSSKSVTALAIGKLIGEGRLSLKTKLIDIFKDRFDMKNADPLLYEQTVEHMLKMTTVYSTATYSEKNRDWLRSYFRGKATHPAGTLWHYDSCGSYVLGAVVKHITGMDFVEYLRPEFDLIGVSDGVFCLKGPDGEAWSSSGFIATTSDLARIAYLFLNGGEWDGQQLISRDYALAAISPLVTNHERGIITRYCCGYGYQIWSHPDGAFAFRGLGGQIAIGFPDRDLVFACNCDTASNATTYDDVFDSVESVILPHFPKKDGGVCNKAQKSTEKQLSVSDVKDVTYKMEENPIGIEEIRFEGSERDAELLFTQHGENRVIEFSTERETVGKFPIAYTGSPLFSEDDFMQYRTSTTAEWVEPRKLLIRVWAEDLYVGNLAMFFYFTDDKRLAVATNKHAQFYFNEFNGYAYGKAVIE